MWSLRNSVLGFRSLDRMSCCALPASASVFLDRLAVWGEAAKERIARLQAQLTSKTSVPPPSLPGLLQECAVCLCVCVPSSVLACGRSTGHRKRRRCLCCWKRGWPGPSCSTGSCGLVPCASSRCFLRQCLEDGRNKSHYNRNLKCLNS